MPVEKLTKKRLIQLIITILILLSAFAYKTYDYYSVKQGNKSVSEQQHQSEF